MIAELCAGGILLTDNGGGDAWQARARELMARGPKPLTESERGSRCYDLSALIDDLAGSQNEAETFVLTADVFRKTADLLLLETGGWLGGGKWVIRRLARSGNELAVRLDGWAADPRRTAESLAALAREVLEGSGGYIQEGFMRGEANTVPHTGPVKALAAGDLSAVSPRRE